MKRTAIITGAGSGIGRASVHEFLSAGYNVLACDSNEAGLLELQSQSGNPDELVVMQMDAGNETDVENAVSLCISKFRTIDVMFANAGISGNLSPLMDMDKETMEHVFRVNVFGVMFAFKHAARAMIRLKVQHGCLLATSSVAGLRSGAGGSVYSASKASVINLVQTAANELTGTGIRVNALCPGVIETGMTKIMFDMADMRDTRSRIGQLNPQQRYGVSKEIATVALFLCSQGASYVNGQAIAVDGGLSSSLPVVMRKSGERARM